eukprot:847192-Pyramimonas_sp.AAC.1
MLDGARVVQLGALVPVAPPLELLRHVGCPLRAPEPLDDRLRGGLGASFAARHRAVLAAPNGALLG